MSDWSGGVPFFCFVSADQFSYQQDGSGDDGDQDHQTGRLAMMATKRSTKKSRTFVEADFESRC